MLSNEDIKELMGFDRNDPNVTVRQIPVPGLTGRLASGQGIDLEALTRDMESITTEDIEEAMNDIVSRLGLDNVVDANIPHAGDDADEEVTAAETNLAEGESTRPPAYEPPPCRPETGDERWARQGSAAAAILDEVFDELERAVSRHNSMHSPHEGYAVIKEEVDELWDEVKANQGFTGMARDEALQVAAMAVRYVLDLDPAYTGAA